MRARRLVGDFYAAAMDTNRLEKLAFSPLDGEFARIAGIRSPDDAMELLADWHRRGIAASFGAGVQPDAKNSSIYALYLGQGGLGLPDRDYYLADGFAQQRDEYRQHIAKMFQLLGDAAGDAKMAADGILALETEIAKASRSRTELRDQEKNYHKLSLDELDKLTPGLNWPTYFRAAGIRGLEYVIVGQPEFFKELNRLVHPAVNGAMTAHTPYGRMCTPVRLFGRSESTRFARRQKIHSVDPMMTSMIKKMG